MERVAFADESGTTAGLPCYAIGVVTVEARHLDAFNRHFDMLRSKYGICGEVKWTRVRNSVGLVNFAIECLYDILRSNTATFDAIVVNKVLFRNWRSRLIGKEGAFYQTYTYLLRHVIHRTSAISDVFIDERSDSYAKQHEVVEAIGNSMLAELASRGRLRSVRKVKSSEFPGVQVADILTGAINSAHIRYLSKRFEMSPAKVLTIKRLAELIGWDDLCYDTYPHDKFNIWHFPEEFRRIPRSREPGELREPKFICADDLADLAKGTCNLEV